ncbi:hypothetical protein H5T87_10830 [bacterium]|nr:hypothetical protein [bacterium]
MRRNGHYKRPLRVSEGVIEDLKVPIWGVQFVGRKYWEKEWQEGLGLHRLEKVAKNGQKVREKQEEEELKGGIMVLDEVCLKVEGRKMWGLIATNLEGTPKVNKEALYLQIKIKPAG